MKEVALSRQGFPGGTGAFGYKVNKYATSPSPEGVIEMSVKINEKPLRSAISLPPTKGPLRVVSDLDLGLPACSKCGRSENGKAMISRAYCENCERVICRSCIDLGVFGSLSDMQAFVHRKNESPYYYIERRSCPYCQDQPFHGV